MPIDISTEAVITLTDAAKALPVRRQGHRPGVATLYRWSLKGCKGIVLETIQVGGTRCTSREALQRFFERLSGLTLPVAQAPVTPHRRERAIAAAERELAEA